MNRYKNGGRINFILQLDLTILSVRDKHDFEEYTNKCSKVNSNVK